MTLNLSNFAMFCCQNETKKLFVNTVSLTIFFPFFLFSKHVLSTSKLSLALDVVLSKNPTPKKQFQKIGEIRKKKSLELPKFCSVVSQFCFNGQFY